MEFDPQSFDVALGLGRWGLVTGAILFLALLFGLVASLLSGSSGVSVFSRGLSSYVQDIVSLSPSRILAVVRLTLKESVRRKALLVFVVFAILLMFAGWFLTSSNQQETLQVGVHISFLLTAITWLILPAIMFLACWSIPEDIRVRSLHTVVTKPIRCIEVVLGRILGFGVVVSVVVLVMGIAGYVWIQRQVPESVRNQLTCRVPKYGGLYFKDRMGSPVPFGMNTGDVWAFRSYIEGNSRCRAVWIFDGITPEALGDRIHLESRFEAFRTVMGSEDSMQEGVEGQYTLINDIREEAFAMFSGGPEFRGFCDELRDGQFLNAATSLREQADAVAAGDGDLKLLDCQGFAVAASLATRGLTKMTTRVKKELNGAFASATAAFDDASKAAAAVRADDDTAGIKNFGESLSHLADILVEHADDLMYGMPRVEVPLPPFHVKEYHEGEDLFSFDRKLTYTADYESLARYLAEVVSEWNEQGRLAAEGSLVSDLPEALAGGETDISVLNAELLRDVLQEEIDSGAITVTENSLAVAEDRSWLSYFDQLVRAEKLISQDPAGWILTTDLYDDIVFDDQMKIEVSCLDTQLFIGMARPDLFIRLPDNPFYVGYSKALLNTILMLLLVVVIGVTASCIVKGPVAFFLTFAVFLIGQLFHGFMVDILVGNVPGAGMLESATMILQQKAPESGIDASELTQNIIKGADWVTNLGLHVARQLVPNFSQFSDATAYVENGFDVPWGSSMLPAIATFIGFLIPCVLLAAAFLKFRELEAK